MTTLTYLTQAIIDDNARELDGKALTPPALVATDGYNLTYAVDVDIGQGRILRNVPIAKGNQDVFYADAGNAVRLRRGNAGRWEVVGFTKEAPGSYKRVPVNLSALTVGPIEDLSLLSRMLTFGELSTLGPGWGYTVWGARGIFRGGSLIEIRT